MVVWVDRLRIAFLASNNGTSFRAINEAIKERRLNAEAVLLVSNRAASSALEYALANEIKSVQIRTKGIEKEADLALQKALTASGAELVILSGYLKKLGPHTLRAFEGRILNVHPGSLPRYGGQGMYGSRVHQTVLANRETETAATIHLVDGEYDHGRVVAVLPVPVRPTDDADSLATRVMDAECVAYIDLLAKIAAGQIALPMRA